jgi:hypothetical protein
MNIQRVQSAVHKARYYFGPEFAAEVAYHAERHEKQLQRLERAVAAGDKARIRTSQHHILTSFSSKVVCLVRSVDKKGKLTADHIMTKAAELSPFVDCGEKIKVKIEPKASGDGNRHVCGFGIKRKALQTLCVDLLATKFGVDPNDYLTKGRGADRASDRIVELMEEEKYKCFILGDIKDFFPTINWEWIQSATGLPIDVVKHCLIVSDKVPLTVRFPLPPSTTFSSLAGAVRFRLPQGSRAAQFIASLILGPALKSLVPPDRLAFYGDDYAIAAHSEKEAKALAKALHEMFKSHPAGPFQLKRCEIAYAVDGFSFLQYQQRLNPVTGKVLRRPAQSSYERYARKVTEIVRAYPWAIAAERIVQYRYHWMRSFRRWEWIEPSELLLWLITQNAIKAGKALKG